jgi:hypothetical protein
MALINHKKCLRDNNNTLVAAFAATILGLESAWRWLGNQE